MAAGPVLAATAAGAAIGGAIGATRDADRKALRQLLETRLGPENSALAVEIKSADWLRVRERTSHYAGEVIQLELTPDSRRELEALVEDQSLLALLEDHVEVEEGVS